MSKLPNTFIVEMLLELMPNWTEEQLTTASSRDRRVDQKLHYLCLGTDNRQKIMNHEKRQYADIAKLRHDALQKPLANVTFLRDGSINWQESGLYILHPAMGPDANKANPHYTHIKCRFLEEGQGLAKLPETYNITGTWQLKNSWLVGCTLEAPVGMRPRVSVNVKELFEDNLVFQDLTQSLPVYGKREQKKAKAKAKGKSKKAAKGSLRGLREADASGNTDGAAKSAELKSALARLKRKVK